MNATHLIRDFDVGATKIITFCGRAGWKAPNSSDEFDDEHDRRFEAIAVPSKATCKTCRRAHKAEG